MGLQNYDLRQDFGNLAGEEQTPSKWKPVNSGLPQHPPDGDTGGKMVTDRLATVV